MRNKLAAKNACSNLKAEILNPSGKVTDEKEIPINCEEDKNVGAPIKQAPGTRGSASSNLIIVLTLIIALIILIIGGAIIIKSKQKNNEKNNSL